MTEPELPRAMLSPMSTAKQALGELGERIAERWLVARGWSVLDRRFRSGHRDIDLVTARLEQAGNGRTVAFVEVKARAGDAFGGPVSAVGWRKRRELGRSAWVWVDRHGRAGDAYRFDVVGVLVGGRRVRVCHVPDAFALRGWP